MSICILADAADIDRAKQIELEYMSVDDLKKFVDLHDVPICQIHILRKD